MSSPTKTDNSKLPEKLALRRHFLDRFHKVEGQRFRVFDACQGDAVIWNALRKEYACDYWGVDKKKKKGRLSIDSERVLALGGWQFDVIDVDTYGMSWKHWFALLPHVRKRTTVFLTIGGVNAGAWLEGTAARAVGLAFRTVKLPASLACGERSVIVSLVLGQCWKHNLRPVYAAEATSNIRRAGASMRYLGVTLDPVRT